MCDQAHLNRLRSLLEFNLKLLCPWKVGSENAKLSKWFRAWYRSPLVLILIITSFVYSEWDTLSFLAVAENVAFVIAFARSFGYVILVKNFYLAYKQQFDKIFADRKSLPSDPKEQSLTERYCKAEFVLTFANQVNCFFTTFIFLHAFVYLAPNAYQLPLNCYIFFLPIDEFLFAWELNYLILTVTISLNTFLTLSFIPIPFILMNHSCWLLDMALVTTDTLNENLQQDEDIRKLERVKKTGENLKKFVERFKKFVEWQNEVQDLLFWYFNLELQIQSLILCLSIYVLSLNFSAGIILVLFVFCAIQLLLLCWMGSRVTVRMEQLSHEVSKNWHLVPPSQRKTLQMIVHWTQNTNGFSSLFKDVSLETCKAIFEASYSFYAFLRSTNAN